ncbi:MAG: methyl-accepting chemotaxis protein, partial [Negativicutes bacterium]|nr:methyl-accepting chemotaxis protein [Negativicutes bacterium]
MGGISVFFDRNKPDKARQNHSEDSLAALIEGLRRQLAGDYQHRVAIADRSDPLWEAADLLNSLAGHNCRVLKEAAHVINEVVYLGVGSGDDLNQLAKSFAVVNENLRQVTDAVDQLSHSVTGLAESVTKTTEQTIVGRDSMGVAKESVNTVSRETEKSKDQLAGLTGNVGEMHDSMSKIDSLVTVVKGVSDQTNLLALNAAIEAARAGEHGRGFAVVAEEVRKLADQSRGSVDEITNQLGNIRASVNNINRAFQDMAAAFNNNLQAVEVADDRVEGLNEVFDNIGRSVESLAPIAEQQSATFEEVNATLREVSGTTDKLNETTQHCNQGVMTLLDETNALRLKFAAMNLGFDA